MPMHFKKLSSKLFKNSQNFKNKATLWCVQKLYGKKVQITPQQGALVKGTAVFWCKEDGFRKFIMVRNTAHHAAQTRFPACYSNNTTGPVADVLYKEITRVLGAAFARSLDLTLLEVDRVAAAPTLGASQTEVGTTQVQAIVWLIQVTKEQTELCMTTADHTDILLVPEFALLTETTDPLHKVIYQSVRRKLMESKLNPYDGDLSNTLFKVEKPASKLIH